MINNLKQNLILYYLLLSGLLIRLIFANFPGFHIDTDTFYAWSTRVVSVGFSGFYSPDVWTSYTPGIIDVFFILGILKNILSLNGDQFYFLLKIPSIFADLFLSFIVYKQLLKTSTKHTAFYGLAFCLFNPIFIFNSAIWGAYDGLMTLFIFLSVYYLDRKKLISSSIYFALSVMIKPQAIALAPVFGLFLIKNFSIKNIIKLALPSFILCLLISVPFFPGNPVSGLINLLAKMAGDYNSNSLYAYNVWGIFGFWIDDSTLLGFLPFRIWGLILISTFWIYVFIFFIKRKFNPYLLSALAFMAFFFLPTRVHERYLFAAFPFLIYIALEFKSKILVWLTIILTFLHLLNLYFVYVYYNEFYLKLPRVLYIPGLYEFLENNGKLMSVISSIIFVVITAVIFNISLQKKHND